jgi:hypothetical protein
MQTTGIVTVLLSVALAAAQSAAFPPPLPEECCACVRPAATAPGEDEEARPALFCRAIFSSGERTLFDEQCSDQGGGDFCVSPANLTAAADGLDGFCEELLLVDFAIACPATVQTPVPLLGAAALAGLALGLGAFGTWTARRRARSGR